MCTMRTKRKLPVKYMAFLTIVPLLVVTSLLQIKCPICEGTGHISSTPGMENVELTNFEYKELDIARDVCAQYIVYTYKITLSLKNNGPDDTSGYVKATLKEYRKSRVMDVQYLPVSIKGQSAVDVEYDVGFVSGLDEALKAEVDVEVQSGEFSDKTCNGTGKISLNSWLLANALKKSLKENTRVEKVFTPTPYVPPDIEDVEELWIGD